VVGLASGVVAIAAGGEHACALITSGGVKCWATTLRPARRQQQLDSIDPVEVVGLTSGVTAIAAGGERTCALTTSGGVKCWGYNNRGQLGDNSNTDRWTPVDVVGLTSGVVAIAAGLEHTCALTAWRNQVLGFGMCLASSATTALRIEARPWT